MRASFVRLACFGRTNALAIICTQLVGRLARVGFDFIWSFAGTGVVHFKSHGFSSDEHKNCADTREIVYVGEKCDLSTTKCNNVLPSIAKDYNGPGRLVHGAAPFVTHRHTRARVRAHRDDRAASAHERGQRMNEILCSPCVCSEFIVRRQHRLAQSPKKANIIERAGARARARASEIENRVD